MNEAAVLENLCIQWCNLSVNKIEIVVYFSKLIYHFSLMRFQVHISKFSAQSDKFFVSYGNLFGGLLFIQTQWTFDISYEQSVVFSIRDLEDIIRVMCKIPK